MPGEYAGLNAVLAFWIAYVLTRPLGASIGDYLSQPSADGGLGLGTTVTSVIFLATILGVVLYLVKTKKDQIPVAQTVDARRGSPRRMLTLGRCYGAPWDDAVSTGSITSNVAPGAAGADTEAAAFGLGESARQGQADTRAARVRAPALEDGCGIADARTLVRDCDADGPRVAARADHDVTPAVPTGVVDQDVENVGQRPA